MPPTPSPQTRSRYPRRLSSRWAIARRVFKTALIGLCLFLISSLGLNLLRLPSAAASPTDAFLVLGGSIQREIRAGELAKQHPDIPILISQGSPDPCIWLIFQQLRASVQQVWLEKCANSTFTNFYFGMPILQRWRVHHIKLITSSTHLPRAIWLAAILLGSHGIWVEPEIVAERGIPANHESRLKTGLDVSRSLIWAVVSQIYQPRCARVKLLAAVNWVDWPPHSFHCEHQGNLKAEERRSPGHP